MITLPWYNRYDLPTPWSPVWLYEALNRSSLRVAVQPTAEPVTLAEAAAHLRLDQFGSPLEYADEDLVLMQITAAREYVEGLSGLMLASQTMQLAGRSFFGMSEWCDGEGIPLKCAPITGIDSISYYNGDGVLQTVDPANYELDFFSPMPRVVLLPGASWPSTQDRANAVVIQFTAGYDNGSPTIDSIPKSLKQAILLVLGHLYENREQTTQVKLEELPLGVTALVERYRLRMGMA